MPRDGTGLYDRFVPKVFPVFATFPFHPFEKKKEPVKFSARG
jgi:hypothetical protein